MLGNLKVYNWLLGFLISDFKLVKDFNAATGRLKIPIFAARISLINELIYIKINAFFYMKVFLFLNVTQRAKLYIYI